MMPMKAARSSSIFLTPCSVSAKLLDLAGGALSRVGDDPLDRGEPLLDPAELTLQSGILARQQFDLPRRLEAAMAGRGAGLADPGEPGRPPAGRPDRADDDDEGGDRVGHSRFPC